MSSKCALCGKPVYMAEEAIAAGAKWHKQCFKCTSCNKLLDSVTVKDHKGSLYCKSCHGKNFGPQGYGYGGGAGVLSMDGAIGSKPTSQQAFTPAGTGKVSATSKFGGASKCPRCGKSVYAAEKVVGAGQEWHKGCFSCLSCKKKLDSTTVCDKDGEIYCKACYGKNFGFEGLWIRSRCGCSDSHLVKHVDRRYAMRNCALTVCFQRSYPLRTGRNKSK